MNKINYFSYENYLTEVDKILPKLSVYKMVECCNVSENDIVKLVALEIFSTNDVCMNGSSLAFKTREALKQIFDTGVVGNWGYP
jgi:hypothetical protein